MAAYTATFIQLYPDKVGAITSWSGTVLGIGYSVGPVIGGFLYDIGGFYLPFMVIGILAIIFSIFTFVAESSALRVVGTFNTSTIGLTLM